MKEREKKKKKQNEKGVYVYSITLFLSDSGFFRVLWLCVWLKESEVVKGVLPKTLARNVNANVSEREEEKVKEGPRLKRPTNKSDLCEAQANIDQPFI